METIFIRSNNDVHDESCDVSHLYLEHDIHGIVYCGMVLGRYIPTDVIQYEYVGTEEASAWLIESGYSRAPDDII